MRRWILPAVITVMLCAASALGGDARTQNFIVTAPTPELAREIADAAENYRRDLAIEWLGKELPNWQSPCPIEAQVSPRLPAGGATSFMFQNRQPFGWTMSIQGTRERVLDSVLPHEVTHTIFATHFGRPLPRWADEGACTTVEHSSERGKQERLLVEFLSTNRGIAFNKMFAMKEYPSDILPLYSQGYALARFLMNQGGKQKFIQYVGEGMDRGMDRNAWTATTRKYYGYESLGELQTTWLEWVQRGTPEPVPQDLVKIQLPANNGNELFVGTTANQPSTQQVVEGYPSQQGPQAGPPVAPEYVANNSKLNPRPNSASAYGTEESSSARIPSEGWYERMRDDVRSGKAPPTNDSPKSTAVTPANTILLPPAPSPPPAALPEGAAASNSAANPNPFRTSSNDRQVLLEWRRSEAQQSTPADNRRDWARTEAVESNSVFRR